ncbi:HAD family hydrolase [Salinibacter sp. 10B]|uniref:HAD-IG family 5'-nucleotidase n=1 Tax=Salinibacter sp. 10B TaxID=1923971 RepID=UPI000CF55B7B|nr:HAD-IG family 5'-nucleotidase [Salinibacter sp. 10B]PQJ34817.1 HAD family hydrolase [Salinibacter sp. 10B]
MESIDPARGLFCNRTLNLRGIRAIGYDMDYTLVHYHMREWEQRAYSFIKEGLLAKGWPVEDLAFDPDLVIRGLVLDTEHGNVVKANRFGYVKRAFHGTEPLNFDRQREVYQRTLVDLGEDRWHFLNTLFSISSACMYMQLVDLLDANKLGSSMGYADLFEEVQQTLDEAHMEGRLKEKIVNNPGRFVNLDPEMPLTLLDQKRAGKKVLLITNSEWDYARPMLEYAFNDFLPEGMTWRDLFDLSIVGARKPDFFSVRMPAFRVESEDGLLREHKNGPLEEGHVYVGANAPLVEESLGLRGEEILYVGDHLFVDVNVSKKVLRWRTALVVRELETEIEEFQAFAEKQDQLSGLMEKKEQLEAEFSAKRLQRQRLKKDYGGPNGPDAKTLEEEMQTLRTRLTALDERIAPLAKESSRLVNENWGPLMRTGKDKSLFARQVERYADVYTGRVSNFLHHTPFTYLRSHRGSLPHDEAAEREPKYSSLTSGYEWDETTAKERG